MSTIAKRLNIYLTAFDPPTQNNLKSSQKVQIINFRKFNCIDDKAIDDRIKIFVRRLTDRTKELKVLNFITYDFFIIPIIS